MTIGSSETTNRSCPILDSVSDQVYLRSLHAIPLSLVVSYTILSSSSIVLDHELCVLIYVVLTDTLDS